jgi:hypothetical protein
MSVNRAYIVVTGNFALSTSQLAVAYFAPPATADANVCKIKQMTPGASGATPASNADVMAWLYKVTGTVGNNTAYTPAQLAGNALAANTVVDVAASSAGLSGLTQSGNPLWVNDQAQNSGADWADDDSNTGKEIALLPSTKYALYIQSAVGAGTDMNCNFGIWFFE